MYRTTSVTDGNRIIFTGQHTIAQSHTALSHSRIGITYSIGAETARYITWRLQRNPPFRIPCWPSRSPHLPYWLPLPGRPWQSCRIRWQLPGCQKQKYNHRHSANPDSVLVALPARKAPPGRVPHHTHTGAGHRQRAGQVFTSGPAGCRRCLL